MNLSTKYMGLNLKNPLVASASPLSREISNIKKLEDAGASAVVMYSLFEEQITHERDELDYYLTRGTESFAEALTYFPPMDAYSLGPDEYLKHISKAKEAVGIPIIGSLNGISDTGWIDYSKSIEEAGADAIEINVYYIPTDLSLSGSNIEDLYLENLRRVKNAVNIPVAMKLSPYFSSMANMAKRLDEAGADGLVLFNRFYQPDINLDSLEVEAGVILSTSNDLRLPLRWVAILYGRIEANLAATTGIHSAVDALKMIMSGADVTMLCAALLKNGIGRLSEIKTDMTEWMEKRGYESIEQIKGIMSHKSVENPAAFERANYMKAISEFKRGIA